MPIPKRDTHSGALIFVKEPHERIAEQNALELAELRSELDRLRELIKTMTPKQEVES